MNKAIYQFFERDHRRIEALLDEATANPEEVKMEYYQPFRVGLLTHIKMEEKILFPAAQRANKGEPIPLTAKLRLEHGALTSLMVVPPSADVIKVIRHIMEKHDLAEEEPGGMYDICEALTQGQTKELLGELAGVTPVPVHPHNEASFALGAAKRAVVRAGYDFDDIVRLKTS